MKVRYYGSAGLPTGYGTAANELAMSLLGAGCDVELRLYGTDNAKLHKFEGDVAPLEACVRSEENLDPNPDVVLVHALPFDCWPILRQSGFGERKPGGPLRVAYTTWEGVSAVPAEICEVLSAFDQVWVPSEQNADCFRRADIIPAERIHVVPHSFAEESLELRRRPPVGTAVRVEQRPPYRFYFFGTWCARKNLDGLLMAWAHAFSSEDPVELNLYCPEPGKRTNGDKLVARSLQFGASVRSNIAKINLIAKTHTDAEVLAIHRDNDCYVTATRGEAFNLPAFHAMLAGRRVIHPIGTGLPQFANVFFAKSTVLYNAIETPAFEEIVLDAEPGRFRVKTLSWAGLNAKSLWLEPDLVALADAMRNDYHDRRSGYILPWEEKFGRRVVGANARKILEAGNGL